MGRFNPIRASLTVVFALGVLRPALSLAQDNPASTNQANVANAASRPLDAPVDRTRYRVGPGDLVMISFFGDLAREYVLNVTPEGNLVVPGVGVVEVEGATLEQAEATVRRAIFRLYQNVQVRLTLLQLRTFKVFLTGNVAAPGIRTASPVTRASEVLLGDTGAAKPTVAPRNILLRRSDDTVRIDLARFQQLGDLEANPTLQEGDVLLVPHADETVQAFGRVFFPGTYEFRRGESLADFLRLINGGQGFPSNAADTVRLSRFVDATERKVEILSRAEAAGEYGESILLQPFDAVYVPAVSNFKPQWTATIEGQVNRPGTYPIVPGETTIRELVALAGGFTPEASLANTTLERAPAAQEEAQGELDRVPPELLTDEERQLVRIRSGAASTNVVVDFRELFARNVDVYNQRLQTGDRLFVARHRNEVVVLGAVARPGIVQFTTNQQMDYFIRLAGGFTERADRSEIVVFKGRLGTPVPAGDLRNLDPGDTVVVPFEERRSVLEVLRGFNAVVTTVAGVVFTIMTLAGRFGS